MNEFNPIPFPGEKLQYQKEYINQMKKTLNNQPWNHHSQKTQPLKLPYMMFDMVELINGLELIKLIGKCLNYLTTG